MERLILARHGESRYSASGLVNGDPEAGVGLTPAGEEEARELGRALAAELLDLCLVTSLPRTRATAELVLAGRAQPEQAPALRLEAARQEREKRERSGVEDVFAAGWCRREQLHSRVDRWHV